MMNYWHLCAAIVSFVAFVAHLIPGSKETLSLRHSTATDQAFYQAYGVWHMVSVDLLIFAGIFLCSALGYFPENKQEISLILTIWLCVWMLGWVLTVGLATRRWTYLVKLPQWILFLVLLLLGYLGFS